MQDIRSSEFPENRFTYFSLPSIPAYLNSYKPQACLVAGAAFVALGVLAGNLQQHLLPMAGIGFGGYLIHRSVKLYNKPSPPSNESLFPSISIELANSFKEVEKELFNKAPFNKKLTHASVQEFLINFLSDVAANEKWHALEALKVIIDKSNLGVPELTTLFGKYKGNEKIEYLDAFAAGVLHLFPKSSGTINWTPNEEVISSADNPKDSLEGYQYFLNFLQQLGPTGRKFFVESSPLVFSVFYSHVVNQQPELNQWVHLHNNSSIVSLFTDSSVEPAKQMRAATIALKLVIRNLINVRDLTTAGQALCKISEPQDMDKFYRHLIILAPAWRKQAGAKNIGEATFSLLEIWRKIPSDKIEAVVSAAEDLNYTEKKSLISSYCKILEIFANCEPAVLEACHKSVRRFSKMSFYLDEHKHPQERGALYLRFIRVILAGKTDAGKPFVSIEDLYELEQAIEKELLSPEKLSAFEDERDIRDRICLLLVMQDSSRCQTLVPLLTEIIGVSLYTGYIHIDEKNCITNLKEAILCAQKMLPILARMEKDEKLKFFRQAKLLMGPECSWNINEHIQIMGSLITVKEAETRAKIVKSIIYLKDDAVQDRYLADTALSSKEVEDLKNNFNNFTGAFRSYTNLSIFVDIIKVLQQIPSALIDECLVDFKLRNENMQNGLIYHSNFIQEFKIFATNYARKWSEALSGARLIMLGFKDKNSKIGELPTDDVENIYQIFLNEYNTQ